MNNDNKDKPAETVYVSTDTIASLHDAGINGIDEINKAVDNQLGADARRVFHVDVDNMSADEAKSHLSVLMDAFSGKHGYGEDYFFNNPVKKYYSTKKIGPISTGHRQWRDDKHCKFAHGYGRYVQFTFECDELDHRSWVVDFGGLKEAKKWLESQWDHRMLIASDDPLLSEFQKLHDLGGIDLNVMDVSKGYGPGIEASCNFVYDHINPMIEKLTDGRCRIKTVEIWEHEFNTARLEINY